MKPNYHEQVDNAFGRVLDEFGFILVEAKEAGLGGWRGEYASKRMRIRFTGDRGDIMVDISCVDRGGDWLDLILIETLVVGSDSCRVISLNELADFMGGYYSTVANLLTPNSFSATVKEVFRLGEERASKLFPGS